MQREGRVMVIPHIVCANMYQMKGRHKTFMEVYFCGCSALRMSRDVYTRITDEV